MFSNHFYSESRTNYFHSNVQQADMYKVRNWHLVCLIARLQNHSLRLFTTEQQTIKLMNEAISVSRRIRYRVLLEKSIPFIGVRIYEPW